MEVENFEISLSRQDLNILREALEKFERYCAISAVERKGFEKFWNEKLAKAKDLHLDIAERLAEERVKF